MKDGEGRDNHAASLVASFIYRAPEHAMKSSSSGWEMRCLDDGLLKKELSVRARLKNGSMRVIYTGWETV